MTTDYEQEIKRHYRWNLLIIAGVDGCWGFGSAFTSYRTVLPLFLDRLGASDLAIAMLPALFSLALFAPQLAAAHFTRHLTVKKVFFTLTHYPGTLTLIALGVIAACYSVTAPSAVVTLTFVWAVIFGLSISFAMPMWLNLMAKLFPAAVRGRSFGYVWLLHSICGAVGALCAARILKVWVFPRSFAILFVLGGIILTGCVTTFFWLREPPREGDRQKAPAAFLRDALSLLRTSHDFTWLLVARFVSALAMMATAFYTVAGVRKFSLPDDAAGIFGAILLSSQVLACVVGGRLGDRFGFKPLLVLSCAADVTACLLALFAPGVWWYYGVFVMFGARQSLVTIGGHNLTIEFCPSEDKTTFVALAGTVLCPAYVLAALAAGLLAKYHPAHCDAVFTVALVCAIAALGLTVAKVKDPRRQPPDATPARTPGV